MAHHYDTYREELAKAYPGFGYALWEPDPGKQDPGEQDLGEQDPGEQNIPIQVGVGDVGFVREGRFQRLFNTLLPADHPSNQLFGVPEHYEPLRPSRPNHINCGVLAPNTFHSSGITVVSGGFGVLASS